MIWFLSLFLLGAYLAFAYRRLLTFLHIFQQEEYDPPRFLRWLIARGAFDRKASLGLVVCGVVGLALPSMRPVALLAGAGVLGTVFMQEADPRLVGKKALALTARAKRLLWSALALLAVCGAVFVLLGCPVLLWVLLAQVPPLALAAVTLLWKPYEQRHNQAFIDEAREKLASLKPKIVGITGSFGKTSVKHILGHLLNVQAPTLVTPGSVNTELGITRIVREKLAARDRFFVCEMGAYGIGSIARLCRLAPPDIGIITAIGHAHYERFKSLDTVVRAKFELAEAVAAKHGQMIIHDSVLIHDYAADFVQRHRGQVVIVGTSDGADVHILASGQTKDGVHVELMYQGHLYRLAAKLYGAHHAGNMAIAFAAAVALGADPADLMVAVSGTPQIKHRSEVKTHPTGAVLIVFPA